MDEFADACKRAIAQLFPESVRLVEKGATLETPHCEKCERPVYCRAMCAAHYRQWKRANGAIQKRKGVKRETV